MNRAMAAYQKGARAGVASKRITDLGDVTDDDNDDLGAVALGPSRRLLAPPAPAPAPAPSRGSTLPAGTVQAVAQRKAASLALAMRARPPAAAALPSRSVPFQAATSTRTTFAPVSSVRGGASVGARGRSPFAAFVNDSAAAVGGGEPEPIYQGPRFVSAPYVPPIVAVVPSFGGGYTTMAKYNSETDTVTPEGSPAVVSGGVVGGPKTTGVTGELMSWAAPRMVPLAVGGVVVVGLVAYLALKD